MVNMGLGIKKLWNGARQLSEESSGSSSDENSESSPFADPDSMLTFSDMSEGALFFIVNFISRLDC